MIKNNFWASTYLECVCEESRNDIVENQCASLLEFREKIKTLDYDELMELFCQITESKMIIMFQCGSGKKIDKSIKYNEIVVLAESTKRSDKRVIPILRSELLDYYRNNNYSGQPSSKLLLNVNSSIKIVSVDKEQEDLIVKNYHRQPCTITYIRLEYFKDLNSEKKQYLYLAMFYEESKKTDLSFVLDSLKKLLSFRYDLMNKIKDDFHGNLYGEKKKQEWRNKWLSIEKAGAHADSALINQIIDNSNFNSKKTFDAFFSENFQNNNENKNETNECYQIVQLISNIMIARYFRAILCPDDTEFFCKDNIINSGFSKYCSLEDVFWLKDDNTETLRIHTTEVCFENYERERRLYGKLGQNTQNKVVKGMPGEKYTTYRKRYLIAFIVDILNNLSKYGKKAKISIEETPFDLPNYLVFQNDFSSKNGKSCGELNYELKQSSEFDNAFEPIKIKGISIGCLTHFMQYYSHINVYYEENNGKIIYSVKLPILS